MISSKPYTAVNSKSASFWTYAELISIESQSELTVLIVLFWMYVELISIEPDNAQVVKIM